MQEEHQETQEVGGRRGADGQTRCQIGHPQRSGGWFESLQFIASTILLTKPSLSLSPQRWLLIATEKIKFLYPTAAFSCQC